MNPDDLIAQERALPIADYRQRILDSVDANQVTIIVAETGAGKSTQVPQYLLEHGFRKVIVTQPRILAARNLSARVREEWLARYPGEDALTVGYRTAPERDDTDATRILYCTDGLQLVREVTGAGTLERQVLILDEIHEWNQNMEVLVAWARKRCLEEPRFKVVVMSATIDAASLARYFSAAPPIQVPGRSFPIEMKPGDDLVEEIHAALEAGGRNVLVFLPGKSEIENVAARVGRVAEARDVPVIPLHSQLEAEEQQLAFVQYPNGKVILSTNIAQTSVTIDDIDLVIDSGLERRSEIEHGVEGLVIGQASRADCLQRAGRAGRTKPGTYVLATLDRMPCDRLEEREAYAVPEIARTHLDRSVLRLAAIGIDIEELEFFHAPDDEAVIDAKRTLRSLGAMDAEGGVTEIGRHMERFPLESRYARMLVESEGLADQTRLKLAAVIAIQEVGGIVRGGAKSLGWMGYTTQTRSDLLAQYEVFLAVPDIDPEELEELGIIAKNVLKAGETLARLRTDLGMGGLEPGPIRDGNEEDALMRCIVAGETDRIWRVEDGFATHVSGGRRRELSGGRVVLSAGLVSGTPFNLEVPTAQGIGTLHLVQDLTAVDPRWLEAAAPHLFRAQAGKLYFDGRLGGLARRWLVTFKGAVIKGASTPVRERTSENGRLFAELYGVWLHDRLEEDRVRMQKETGQRIAVISVHRVQERVRAIADGAVALADLDARHCVDLANLGRMRTYLSGAEMARLEHSRRHGRQRKGRGKRR